MGSIWKIDLRMWRGGRGVDLENRPTDVARWTRGRFGKSTYRCDAVDAGSIWKIDLRMWRDGDTGHR